METDALGEYQGYSLSYYRLWRAGRPALPLQVGGRLSDKSDASDSRSHQNQLRTEGRESRRVTSGYGQVATLGRCWIPSPHVGASAMSRGAVPG